MNRNPQTGALEPFDFEHLLQNVPELKQFDTEIATYQFSPPIDSSDMSPRMWTDLSHVIADHYNDYDGFVVLHGTDTMAYTASALSYYGFPLSDKRVDWKHYCLEGRPPFGSNRRAIHSASVLPLRH